MSTNEIATKADITNVMLEMKELLKEALSKVNMNQKWLKENQVREMLGLSASGLQNLRINGTIPYTKLGGAIYYDYNDLLKILEQNKKNTD